MIRTRRLLAGLGFLVLLLVGPALVVSADAGSPASVNAQVESPYEPPDIEGVETPGWAQPFEPLARLPLWAQAAVLSAGVAGMVFVLPLVGRWVWKLGEGDRDEDADAEIEGSDH